MRPRDVADRRDLLLRRLADQPGITADLLADELGVAIRTIFRDLDKLRDRGYPIESSRGRGGGLRLTARWGLGRVLLSREEALGTLIALAMAARMAQPMFANDVGRARRRIVDAFPAAERRLLGPLRERVVIGPPASPAVTASYRAPRTAVMRVVERAFVETRCLEVVYTREDGDTASRAIEPHVLLINWPAWYLLVHDHGRKAPRTFRLDRIVTASILPGTFTPQPRLMIRSTGAPGLESL
jgi:predicted DNA-binding transcriptional regulator YafY